MSEVKVYIVPGRYLMNGAKNTGAQDVVLLSDYDKLNAKLSSQSDVVKALADTCNQYCEEIDALKSSNKHLAEAIERGLAEDLRLRNRLDEARRLMTMAQGHVNEFVYRDIYSWLEENK